MVIVSGLCHSIFKFLMWAKGIDIHSRCAIGSRHGRPILQGRRRLQPPQVPSAHVFGRRGQREERFQCPGQLLELPGRVVRRQYLPDAVQKRLALAMVTQTAHGARGLFVFQAGHLLGVKDEGMVAQQTQVISDKQIPR